MHSAIIVADLNGRIFQWLDRSGPLLTRSGGKPRRWPPTAFPKRTKLGQIEMRRAQSADAEAWQLGYDLSTRRYEKAYGAN